MFLSNPILTTVQNYVQFCKTDTTSFLGGLLMFYDLIFYRRLPQNYKSGI